MQTTWKDAWIASTIQIGVGYPWEVLKTRAQVSSSSSPFFYRKEIQTIVRQGGGWKAFYRGAFIPWIGTSFSFHSTFFLMNSLESGYILFYEKIPHPHFQIWSSTIAGAMMAIIMNPMEVIKCHRQVGHPQFSPSFSSFFIWGKRGVVPHILREIIGYQMYFRTYFYLEPKSQVQTFFAGSMAGVVSTFFSFPFDVWKTRSHLLSRQNISFSELKETGKKWIQSQRRGLSVSFMRSFWVNGCLFLCLSKEG